jgi:hypothetical protein
MKNWIIILVVVGFLAIFGYSSHLFINKTLDGWTNTSTETGRLQCEQKNFAEWQKALEQTKEIDMDLKRLTHDDVIDMLRTHGELRAKNDR